MAKGETTRVKCNKCGYVGQSSEFPKGNDFFQNTYISKCPKCDNGQSPGDASMRMFGGERPFIFLRGPEPEPQDSSLQGMLPIVLHRADEAS